MSEKRRARGGGRSVKIAGVEGTGGTGTTKEGG